MHSSLVVIILLIFGLVDFNKGAAINVDSTNVGKKMAIPRGYTRQQYLKSIIDFWTPERMATARPLEPFINRNYVVPLSVKNQDNEPEIILTPSSPVSDIRATIPHAVGRAFFVMGGLTYVCSGSVINAKNRDLVVTAGHCVYNTTTKEYATDWLFVPHYDSGERPAGTFVWREIATKLLWMQKADYNHDVAVVLMNTNGNGEHIQDLTGAFGISLNAAKKAATNAFGYPMNINNGETMSTCADTSTNPSLLLMGSFEGLQIKCDMGGGASGGPWLQGYNSNTHAGQQVSLTSFSYMFARGKIHGPHFNNDNIGTLFQEYQNL